MLYIRLDVEQPTQKDPDSSLREPQVHQESEYIGAPGNVPCNSCYTSGSLCWHRATIFQHVDVCATLANACSARWYELAACENAPSLLENPLNFDVELCKTVRFCGGIQFVLCFNLTLTKPASTGGWGYLVTQMQNPRISAVHCALPASKSVCMFVYVCKCVCVSAVRIQKNNMYEDTGSTVVSAFPCRAVEYTIAT